VLGFVPQLNLLLPNVIPAQAGIQKDDGGVGKQYFVYILASKRNGTLYTGITSNLVK
jgi:putative endonuclease